ncbi:MAG TPA: molybdopterin oxidoreductase family protein [Thermoleophilaceae bacterium]|nr:molybdopterin oxidoreductase family protein [Thermoleophilaceae bacterium]
MAQIVRAACPHDCPDTCAMLVTVEDGRATKVEGDPEHPVTAGFLCGKVSNYLDRVYAEDRLLHPLVREGEVLRRASWDEALDRAAAGITSAIAEHGPESLLPYSYAGTMGFLQRDSMGERLMNALGSSRLERTICADAGLVGTLSTHGVSPEVDPEEWPHARYVLAWGWNPMSTAPHLWRLVLEARRNGAKLVVVDPYRSRTARVADEHVRPAPGSDGALALGMMRAIVDAGLQDEGWCREHASGYDELLALLESFPLERAAALTGVPAERIAELGRDFAGTRPALLRLGVGAQRHAGAIEAYRTLACLPALTGAWRERGGGCSYIPSATAGAVDSSGLQRPQLRVGEARAINMSCLGDALTDPALDPPVKALVVWNSNPAQIAPDQERVLRGLRRDDLFVVVLEQFMTDTAALADVVLPATTQLEHLDAHFSWGHQYVTWNEPAIEARGEAKPNTEIFRLLAGRLGLAEHFGQSDEELLAELFAERPGGVSLAELRERGWVKVDHGRGPVPHADGGFGTADGRVNLAAAAWRPPAEVADEALAGRYPLALLTPKTHLFLNSTFPNQERQHSAQPEPFVVLHPADAAARGIQSGSFARVFNDRGSCRLRARVSDDAAPGVAVAPMGWWSRDHDGGVGAQATTPQLLTEIGAAPTFNDNRVEVERS